MTISLTVLQPLKAARAAASAQNCESRFIMGSDKGMQSRSIVVHYQPRFAAHLDQAIEGEVGERVGIFVSAIYANRLTAFTVVNTAIHAS